MYNEQLHPLFRHIVNGINKHIFKPSETDKDYCEHCGKNFRDTTIHLTAMEYDQDHGIIPSNTPVQIIKQAETDSKIHGSANLPDDQDEPFMNAGSEFYDDTAQ